jgi:hypothetical protein
MKHFIAVAMLLIVVTPLAGAANRPSATFTAGDVTLRDVAPGTRVAWMAMLTDRDHYRDRVQVLRGVDVVTPGHTMTVAPANAKPDHGIWAFAAVDGDVTLTAVAPEFVASTRAIDVNAVEGAPSLTMNGARAELLYVRKGSAWKFSAADGGPKDFDNTANGRITIALSALENLHGNRPAPSSIERGDMILLIDFTTRRTATITVGQ